jgi:hypothetical protein
MRMKETAAVAVVSEPSVISDSTLEYNEIRREQQ